MKRSVLVAAVLAGLAFVPGISGASDIVDGRECSMTFLGGRPIKLNPGGGANADRFAVCVSDGVSANGAELYVGGELNPEQAVSGSGFCGAIVVAGRTLAGDADWERFEVGPDPLNPADDVHLICD
ncbi:MAG: hypothetical protein ACRDKS_04555 [Actinomycetota bacterium]